MSGRLLHGRIDGSVARYPDRTAVVMGAERLTYRDLDRLADAIAGAVVNAGCRPGDRVSLMAPKAPLTIAAIIGVLRAGGVYVPIDVTSPAARVARIHESAEPSAICVLGRGLTLADDLVRDGVTAAARPVIDLEVVSGAGPNESVFVRPDMATTDPVAHLLFTSGSTGVPKGVPVRHSSATAFVDWGIAHFGIRPGDRCSGHTPLYFDLSTFDVFGALGAGAELHLTPPEAILPRQIAEYIAAAPLDQLFCVPSLLSFLSAYSAVPMLGFPSLRRVLCCGEVLPTRVLIDWMQRHPQATFTNLYGPTEATIASSFYTVAAPPRSAADAVPIGVPCAGEELVVLAEDGAVAPDEVIGELCIGGVGLSPGYWRAPELSAAAFVPDPRPDRDGERIYRTGDLARRDRSGVFHYVGRLDSQIKHRGYRIELGEIEVAVSSLWEVAECVVVAVPSDGFEGTTICCAAVLSGADSSPGQLRSQLTAKLPAYMLPTQWRILGALPRNANGKVDRSALRLSFSVEGEAAAGNPDR